MGVRFLLTFALFAMLTLLTSPDWVIANAVIRVDAREEIGPLPYLFRTGLFALWGAPPEYVQARLAREHRPGAIEIDIGALVTHPSTSFDDLQRRLQELGPLDSFLQRVEKSGGEAVIAITGMPRWLSANPDAMQPIFPGESTPVAQSSPPRDYNVWSQVVTAIVDHLSVTKIHGESVDQAANSRAWPSANSGGGLDRPYSR
jgi:hypothetical protein